MHRQYLVAPDRLWSRSETLVRPCPVPREPGVYAWFFREVPPGVPADGCVVRTGRTLLYLGISPGRPPANGKPPSRQRLANRIRYHFTGNAEGSTLRLTLGCLLADMLGIELRRVGSGKRMHFGPGEARLSEWMGKNAEVVWTQHAAPWELEAELIAELSLPLNLAQNVRHPFHPALSEIRQAAKVRARNLPIGHDSP
jgi:hypothetical protein